MKKRSKETNKIKQLINNPKTIIIFMIAFFIIMLLWVVSLNKRIKFYSGQIAADDLAVSELHYYTDDKMTYFFANNAVYGGKDQSIYKFDIKYVIKIDNKEYVIEDFNTEFDEKQSLSQMIMRYSKFKVVDLKKQSNVIFTKEMKKNINNLKLIINASTSKDGDYDINLSYDVEIKQVN